MIVGIVETKVKYHFYTVLCLTLRLEQASGQGQAGSLTGAVAS